MDLLKYDHSKPLDVIQMNDIVNYNANDKFGSVKQMHVEIIRAGMITAYKFFEDTKPGGTQRIEMIDNASSFTKLVLKSSLVNDPLTSSINFCNFTLAEHGLKVGHVYDPVKDKETHETTSNKYAIYKGKLYTKSILEKLDIACLVLPTGEIIDGYMVYGKIEKQKEEKK